MSRTPAHAVIAVVASAHVPVNLAVAAKQSKGKQMRIRKSTLKRIIAEATGRMRRFSESSLRDREALADGATPSIEELDKLIQKKQENLKGLESMRGMGSWVEDAIDSELDTLNKLGLLSKQLRGVSKG